MVLASRLSVEEGLIEPDAVERLVRLLRAADLPVDPPSLSLDTWLDWMASDKKADRGRLRFVVLDDIGPFAAGGRRRRAAREGARAACGSGTIAPAAGCIDRDGRGRSLTMSGDGARLAPYAASADATRGRRHDEPPSSTRNEFQRDRDRIIHSSAFRRLEYKTQVFVNHEGDLFRTRLTHSLEVAQIARSIARTLRLDEDLTEAISLAHDLGHTPFGHAGQDALNDCMKAHGGFEHNLQSLRVVDVLEERYGAFDGLNLCFETREGILKHCSLENARTLGDVGRRFVEPHPAVPRGADREPRRRDRVQQSRHRRRAAVGPPDGRADDEHRTVRAARRCGQAVVSRADTAPARAGDRASHDQRADRRRDRDESSRDRRARARGRSTRFASHRR